MSSEGQFSTSEGWVDNGGVRIHYLESGKHSPSKLVPVVYVHSAFGTAEGFLPEMKALWPRRSVSFSLRGRGKSDAPQAGYSFSQNVSDIDTVVGLLGLKHFCLMGWSIGVTYAIAYASRRPDLVAGLILLDYPARHPKWPSGWADRWLTEPSIRESPDRIRGLRGLEQESEEVVLWNDLAKILCPVLVIGGGRPDALLKSEHAEKYRQQLGKVEVVVFPDSGHNVSEPDYDRFVGKVKTFLETLDG